MFRFNLAQKLSLRGGYSSTKQPRVLSFLDCFAALAMTLLLTSCTTITSPATKVTDAATPSWQMRAAQLNRLQNWQMKGKVAVQTTKDAGSASVDWQQQPSHFSISLLGPIGTIGFKLKGQAGSVILDTTDGKHFTAHSAEQLLAEQWGFHLPVSYLRYWVRGLPVANMPAETHFDSSHRLASLSQAGWAIQFHTYKTINGIELPERITATSADMKVKLMIYQWGV